MREKFVSVGMREKYVMAILEDMLKNMETRMVGRDKRTKETVLFLCSMAKGE